jgi:aminobenzoyl-glutamate transport protein
MSKPQTSASAARSSGLFQRFLDCVEVAGNKLPSPFVLFSLLAVAALLLSAVFEGTAVTFAGKDSKMVTVKVGLVECRGVPVHLHGDGPNFISSRLGLAS